MTTVKKYLRAERRALTPTGQPRARISTDQLDSQKDRVMQHGLTFRNPMRVLLGHDPKALPVGVVDGIFPGPLCTEATWRWIEGDEVVARVRNCYEQGGLDASIGFMVEDAEPNELGGYDIHRAHVVEFSLTPVPANEGALALAKDLRGREIDLDEPVITLVDKDAGDAPGGRSVCPGPSGIFGGSPACPHTFPKPVSECPGRPCPLRGETSRPRSAKIDGSSTPPPCATHSAASSRSRSDGRRASGPCASPARSTSYDHRRGERVNGGPQVLLGLQPNTYGLPVVLVENASRITAIFSSTDGIAVQLADTGVVAVGAATGIAAADSIAAVLQDLASVSLVLVPTVETLAVGLADAGSVFATLLSADGAAIALLDTPVLLAMLTSPDAVAIGMADVGTVFVALAASDGVAVVLLDAVALLASLTAADGVAVALDDAGSVAPMGTATPVAASDAVAVTLDEPAPAIAATTSADDQLGVGEVSGGTPPTGPEPAGISSFIGPGIGPWLTWHETELAALRRRIRELESENVSLRAEVARLEIDATRARVEADLRRAENDQLRDETAALRAEHEDAVAKLAARIRELEILLDDAETLALS